MALATISTTDSFTTWYSRCNEIIELLNANTLVAGTNAQGSFAITGANSTLSVVNGFFVTSNTITLTLPTTFGANVSINALVGFVTLAPVNLIIQPSNGSTFNSAVTFKSVVALLNATTVNNTFQVAGNTTLSNTTVNGVMSTAAILSRQLLFTSVGAAVNAALSSNQADYTVTGLEDAQILNLTPSVDCVVSGLAAPAITSGVRLLYIQNLSPTYKVTFSSGNTSSVANNRFQTPSDNVVDLRPGASIAVMWSADALRWRVLSSISDSAGAWTAGNTIIGGTLSVTGLASFDSNVSATSNTLFIDTVNERIGVGTGAPQYKLHVNGSFYTTGAASFLGNVAFSANLSSTANVSLANGAIVGSTTGKNVTFANTITANTASQSYIRNLLVTTLTVNSATALANLTVTGNSTVSGTLSVGSLASFSNIAVTGLATISNLVANIVSTTNVTTSFLTTTSALIVSGLSTFSANISCNAVINTTNGFFVLPVGTDKWAVA